MLIIASASKIMSVPLLHMDYFLRAHKHVDAAMMMQLREQVKSCLNKKKEGPDTEVTLDQQRIQIEVNQTNTLKLCTEKVLLAQQAYDLVRFPFIACISLLNP